MKKIITVVEGGQYSIAGAKIACGGITVHSDGSTSALCGIGLPHARVMREIVEGETLSLDGWGSLTYQGVIHQPGRSRRCAQLLIEDEQNI
jgi:hypothetical protein